MNSILSTEELLDIKGGAMGDPIIVNCTETGSGYIQQPTR